MIAALRTCPHNRKEALIGHIEDLRIEKPKLIDKQGERLANRLKTKWYNEGERSNKYFLRLLNRVSF